MSNDLLNKLGEKIQNAVETIEILRVEVEELKERNSGLQAEKEEWDSKLTALIEQFENIEYESSDDSEEEEEGEEESDEYEEEEDDDGILEDESHESYAQDMSA